MTPTPNSDLTTAARIRDIAIEVFGDNGFQVGVRAIATAADVSPGLVNHHFGSKDGLRAACDERVLQLIRDQKWKTATETNVAKSMLTAMSEIEAYGPLVAYMVRSLQAGGPLAESLLEHMISDAEEYIQAGVEAGTIKPSRDPAARARYLTMVNVGASVLYFTLLQQRGEKIDYRKLVRTMTEEFMMPAAELYAQGFLTDPTILDILTKET